MAGEKLSTQRKVFPSAILSMEGLTLSALK